MFSLHFQKKISPISAFLFAAFVLLAFSPALYAQDAAPQAKQMVGNDYVTGDGFVLVDLYPAQLMTMEATELYPTEILEAWCLDNIGIAPKDCDRIRAVMGAPAPSPMGGLVISLSKPFKATDLNQQLIDATAQTAVDGKACIPINGPPGVYVHQLNPTTLIVASEIYISQMVDLAEGGGDGALPDFARTTARDGQATVIVAIEPVRLMLNGAVQMLSQQVPPDFQKYAELPALLDALILNVDLANKDAGIQLKLVCKDADAAEEALSLVKDAMTQTRQIAMAQIENELPPDGEMRAAMRAYANRIADMITETVAPKQDGRSVVISMGPSNGLATPGVLMSMLAPVMAGVRQRAVVERAELVDRRREVPPRNVKNAFRQIGLALHNYHSAHHKLPGPGIRGADGKLLLSWRVAVLPYLERADLYEQFHLDEPWDSPHNIKLLDRMPAVFKHPTTKTDANKTVYQLPMAKGTIVSKEGESGFRDVLDGLSNTIMVVESNPESAVPWTRPVDLELDLAKPVDKLGFTNGRTNVLIADGSVQVFDKEVDPKSVRRLMTRSGRD